VSTGVGKEYIATNGILQGCPLSVVLLNALVSIWAKCLESECPEVNPTAYVDDNSAYSTKPKFLQRGLEVTMAYAQCTGQAFNIGKCGCFTTVTQQMHRLKLGDDRLNQVSELKLLGATLEFDVARRHQQDARIKDAREVTKRVSWAPLPFDAKAILLTSLVSPMAFFGCSVMSASAAAMRSMRIDCLNALFNGRRGRRCAEIVFTLFTRGHRIDAWQALLYTRLVTWHRMVNSRPDLQEAFCAAWVLRDERHRIPAGPVQMIAADLVSLGWAWVEPMVVFDHEGCVVDIRQIHKLEWSHRIRDALRRCAWRTAAQRRRDMVGIEDGIDRGASLQLLDATDLDVAAKGKLRTILSGGVWTQERASRAYRHTSAVCPFCSTGEEEDHEHLWWRCPTWSHIRACHSAAMEHWSPAWPPCFKWCGIMPAAGVVTRSTEDKAAEQQFSAGQLGTGGDEVVSVSSGSSPALSPRSGRETEHGELCIDGFVVVYTDGACRDNQDRAKRVAGVGAFWGEQHPFNISEPLNGCEQSNNRAELTAVIRALQLEVRAVEVRSDSTYVVDGINKRLAKWKRQGFATKTGMVKNHDLWKILDGLLSARERISWKITKVRGHASAREVREGKVDSMDKEGNDWADALAVAGCNAQSSDWRLRQSLAARLRICRATQLMMVDILCEREKMRAEMAAQKAELMHTSQSDNVRSDDEENALLGGAGSVSSSSSSSHRSCRTSRRRGRSAPHAAE